MVIRWVGPNTFWLDPPGIFIYISIKGPEKTKEKIGEAVREFIANKMVTNIHVRGNCSVVCMERLPYDLEHGGLEKDTIQGYPVNRNLNRLRNAKTILSDSVGAGMTRSSILQIRP
jgi:hypothetical protein